jgi:hypothetical protein
MQPVQHAGLAGATPDIDAPLFYPQPRWALLSSSRALLGLSPVRNNLKAALLPANLDPDLRVVPLHLDPAQVCFRPISDLRAAIV